MTRYIGKKIIISLVLLLTAGFVLYMLSVSASKNNEMSYYSLGLARRIDGEIYYYLPDNEHNYMSMLCFIPIETITADGSSGIIMSFSDYKHDFGPKTFACPFTDNYVTLRHGLHNQVYKLNMIK